MIHSLLQRLEALERRSDLPSGSVLIWSGAANAIPAGWHLCDGTGGTPDLRGRFVIGAGGASAPGATGGGSAHSHTLSGSVGATTLSVAQEPSHNHSAMIADQRGGGTGNFEEGRGEWDWWINAWTTSYTGGSQAHTHSLSASSAAADHLPPYYALCYIMKL